jgi:toxin HigB-1
MTLPRWKLHGLIGNMAGHYLITVNGNWRMTFTFDDGGAVLANYQDYH